MNVPYAPPTFQASAFNCPSCGAYAQQIWRPMRFLRSNSWEQFEPVVLGVATCERCQRFTVWVDQKLVFPEASSAPLSNPDLPDDIQADYNEAASIMDRSPRGAAALLRLAIQKLCKHLGQRGKNLDDDIAALVADGLPLRIQQALDIVRVIGNEAVHPGEMEISDDVQTVMRLFVLLNLIAENRISEPKDIESLYGELPQGKREAIELRNQRALKPGPQAG